MPKIKNALLHRVYVRPWVYALALGCFSLNAQAALEIINNGNTKTLVFPSNSIGGSPTYFEVPSSQRAGTTPTIPPTGTPAKQVAGGFAITNPPAPGTLRVVGLGDIPLGNTGKKASPVEFKANIPARSAAKAMIRGAVSLSGYGLLAVAAYDIYGYLTADLKLQNPRVENGELVAEKVKEGSGYEFQFADKGWRSSPSAACNDVIAFYVSNGGVYFNYSFEGYKYTAGVISGCKVLQVNKQNGSTFHNEQNLVSRKSGSASTETVTQQQIEDMIAANTPGWPSSAARALAQALNQPGVGVQTDPPTVSGPASVPGEKTTTTEKVQLKNGTNTVASSSDTNTQSGTKTTTKSTVHNVTYNNNNVSHNTKTTTTTNITNNVTNITTTDTDATKEEVKEDDAKEDPKTDCEKNPEALMCQKVELDTPEGEIPKKNREVTLTEENLFGSGSCPADVYFNPSGVMQQLKLWDWNQACGHISTYVKPILILTCTFTAFMILVPGKTE